MRIAILASGTGSNCQAIIDKIKSGALDASIELLISNNPRAEVLKKAEKADIPHRVIEKKNFPDRAAYDSALVDALVRTRCELVVLAGYMLLVGGDFFEVFRDRMINLHPSLLPAFPGAEGIAGAVNYGVKITGASVHFVEEEVDSGPLIVQAAVPVNEREPLDALKHRIHAMEHRILPQAVQWFAEGRISREGRMVHLAPGNRKQIRPDGAWFVWPPLEEGF